MIRQLDAHLATFRKAEATPDGKYKLIELYKQDKKEFAELNSYDAIAKGPIEKGAHGYLVPFKDYLFGPTKDTPGVDVNSAVFLEAERLRAELGDLRGANVPEGMWRLQLQSTI